MWILGPDKNGKCCGCEKHKQPCDECPADEWTPSVVKTCSGPGNGMVGEVIQNTSGTWKDGLTIWYQWQGENLMGGAAYKENKTLGPVECPYGSWYCQDATWVITWNPPA